MIKDAAASAEIQKGWAGVRGWQGKTSRNLAFAFGMGGILGEAIIELPFNMTFVFAYGILNDVLEQLRDEGNFACNGRELGRLMAASRPSLPWTDFPLVKQGQQARNKVAHELAVIPRADCWAYIDAIEAELLAWKIIPSPITWR